MYILVQVLWLIRGILMSKREYDIDSIGRLYQAGKTFREIANIYGISRSATGRILRKLEIPIRPTGTRLRSTLTCYKCKKSFDRKSTQIYPLKGGGCICKQCNKKRAWEEQQGLRIFGLKQKDYEEMLLKQDRKCLIVFFLYVSMIELNLLVLIYASPSGLPPIVAGCLFLISWCRARRKRLRQMESNKGLKR